MSEEPGFPSLEALRGWLALEPAELLRGCVQAPFQGPGPGGQKRNRVYSGVRLTHSASGLSAEASERREARRNLEDALHRLRLAMALSLPAAPPRSTPPPDSSAHVSGGTAERAPTGPAAADARPRIRVDASARHADFPRFVLEALAALEAAGGRLAEAAGRLGVTASALTRFLRAEKAVWARAQEIRKRHGLHPLKSG